MAAGGSLIARYAKLTEIGDEYTEWETEHPGVSSFNWVLGDPYAYTYEILPTKLENAALDAQIDIDDKTNCYKFTKDGLDIYLLWSDETEHTVNFSSQLSGQVWVTYATGLYEQVDASAIQLTQESLFVEKNLTLVEKGRILPVEYKLYQNYPNPFNPVTRIRYQLPKADFVNIRILNLTGRQLRTLFAGKKQPGYYEHEWDGTDDSGRQVSSGVYFICLETANFRDVKKIVLVR